MKRARFWRNVWIVAALAGIAAAIAAFLMPDQGQGFTLQAALGVGGLSIGPLAFILAIRQTIAVRRYARLARGERVMARWTVDPGTWRRFAEINRRLQEAQQGRWRPNLVTVPDEIDAPLTIVVGQDALRVGEEFLELEKSQFESGRYLPGQPGVLELYFCVINPRGADHYFVIRFPVAPGAEYQATRMLGYFNKPVELGPVARVLSAPARAANLNPRTARNIALGVAAVAAVTAVSVISQADSPKIRALMNDEIWSVLIMTAAVGGTLITPVALILALVWHLRGRNAP